MMMPSFCFVSHAECAWVLLAADCMLFPCFYLTDGLLQGIMYSHALPTGSLLDVNNISIFLIVFANAVGRFLGPPVARWNVENGGQWEYALWQLVICFAAIVLLELALFFKAAGIREKWSWHSASKLMSQK